MCFHLLEKQSDKEEIFLIHCSTLQMPTWVKVQARPKLEARNSICISCVNAGTLALEPLSSATSCAVSAWSVLDHVKLSIGKFEPAHAMAASFP